MRNTSPKNMKLVEVGLRDGLQSVSDFIPTEQKLAILDGMLESGFRTIEITSFAHPKVLPQFSDAKEMISSAPRVNGVTYRALAPNLKGVQLAAETEIDEITMVLPVDPGMAQMNQNSTPERLLEEFEKAVEIAHSAGKPIIAGIATAFFAPCRGEVPQNDLHRFIESTVRAGADAIYLAGTTGMETPPEFAEALDHVTDRYPDLPVGVHLHNRNGMGLLNALTSYQHGADWIEASFGGLGGDMWFPGDPSVLGNLPMEDLLNALHAHSIPTGINLDTYLKVVRAASKITGTPSYSFIERGGTREELATASWPTS